MNSNMKKADLKSIVSNQYMFQKGQVILFLKPGVGKVRGEVLGTEFSAQMGYTVSILVEKHGLMQINEKFLQKLQQRAA